MRLLAMHEDAGPESENNPLSQVQFSVCASDGEFDSKVAASRW